MKLIKIISLLLIISCQKTSILALTPTRVILSSDNNNNYLQFWPIVARAWKKITGIHPTLALIAQPTTYIDESLGDVIRFEPIQGIPTAFQAQCIRLLLPALFPDDVCIISDIDMLPLQKKYFFEPLQNVPDTHIAITNHKPLLQINQLPMCYVTALGKTFANIFNVKNTSDIPDILKNWFEFSQSWSTDQKILYRYITTWNKYNSHCHVVTTQINRIDRSTWGTYDEQLLKQGFYIDCHCPRPYADYKTSIETILNYAIEAEKKSTH